MTTVFAVAHTIPLGVAIAKEGKRNPNMESLYDYGSRAGFWRMHRLFTSKKVPVTVFAAGMVSHDLVSCAPFCIGVFPFLAHAYIDSMT